MGRTLGSRRRAACSGALCKRPGTTSVFAFRAELDSVSSANRRAASVHSSNGVRPRTAIAPPQALVTPSEREPEPAATGFAREIKPGKYTSAPTTSSAMLQTSFVLASPSVDPVLLCLQSSRRRPTTRTTRLPLVRHPRSPRLHHERFQGLTSPAQPCKTPACSCPHGNRSWLSRSLPAPAPPQRNRRIRGQRPSHRTPSQPFSTRNRSPCPSRSRRIS